MKTKFKLLKLPKNEDPIANKIEGLKKDFDDDLERIQLVIDTISEYLDYFPYGENAYLDRLDCSIREASLHCQNWLETDEDLDQD